MSHLLIVKRLELYMDLALYKINILLLLLCEFSSSKGNLTTGGYQSTSLKCDRANWSLALLLITFIDQLVSKLAEQQPVGR